MTEQDRIAAFRKKYVDRGIIFEDVEDPSSCPTALGGLYGLSGQDCIISKYRKEDHDYSSDSSERIDLEVQHPRAEVITSIRKTIMNNAKAVKQPSEYRLNITGLSEMSYIAAAARKESLGIVDYTADKDDENTEAKEFMKAFWEAFWQHRTRVKTSRYVAKLLQRYADALSYRITCKKQLFSVVISRE